MIIRRSEDIKPEVAFEFADKGSKRGKGRKRKMGEEDGDLEQRVEPTEGE